MSAETIVSASVSLVAALGAVVALQKRCPTAAALSFIVSGVLFLVWIGSAAEVSRSSARAAERNRHRVKLIADYPLQSLDERLPSRVQSTDAAVALSAESLASLVKLEAENDRRGRDRTELLRGLHEGTVDVFSEEIGQGYMRMPYVTEKILGDYARKDETPLQQETTGSPESGDQSIPWGTIESALKSLHQNGITEFANAADFGFVTSDGKQAAGFISHRFTKPAKPDARIQLRRIDLVGLTVNSQPVVYVSDKLPRMDELKTVPKRALDRFEEAAVASLRSGESVVIHESTEGTRMVGAIRSAKQCQSCHGGPRGELLGAFTYRFHSAPPENIPRRNVVLSQ